MGVIAEQCVLSLRHSGSQMVRYGADSISPRGLLLQSHELFAGVNPIEVRQGYTMARHVGEIESVGDWTNVGISLDVHIDPVRKIGGAQIVPRDSNRTAWTRSIVSCDPT